MKKRSGVRPKILKVFAASLLLVMVLSLNAFANNGFGTVHVPTGIVFVKASQVTRSGSRSFVTVDIRDVYPTDNSVDNYTKCRAQLRKMNSSTPCSDVYTCVQGYASSLDIYQGYLYSSTVDLYFAGNNPYYDAMVAYTYWGN
jgi:hypothetical protein